MSVADEMDALSTAIRAWLRAPGEPSETNAARLNSMLTRAANLLEFAIPLAEQAAREKQVAARHQQRLTKQNHVQAVHCQPGHSKHQWKMNDEFSHHLVIYRYQCSVCGCWAYSRVAEGRIFPYVPRQTEPDPVGWAKPKEFATRWYGRGARPDTDEYPAHLDPSGPNLER